MASTFITFIVIIMIFSYGITYVINSLGIMGCIKKAGEDSFKAWIPIYNEYLLYRISGMKGALIAINIALYISVVIFIGVYVGAINKAMNYTEESIRNITSSSISSTSSTKRTSRNTIYSANNTYSTNNTYKNRYTTDDIVKNIEVDESDYDEVDEFDVISKYMAAFMILYCILMALSAALFVIRILLAINLAKVFDLGGGYIAGLILVPQIFLLIVAFGKCKYVGKYKTAEDTSL
ncbi:MAG: hypothetical protein J6J36_07630 [Clostridia bacterium]|nr:hypothetical protein [Clostridia bacterium]